MTNEDAASQKAKKFVEILEKTEKLPALKMQAYQRRLQERLVRHAKAQVPFYEKRLNPLFGPKDTIRWDAWADIEPFTRSQAQEAGDALYAKSSPSQAGGYSVETTSGSTGMPLTVRVSDLMGLMSKSINQRIYNWHNVNPNQSVCFLLDDSNKHQLPDGDSGNNWNLLNTKAVAHSLSVNHNVEQQTDWILRKSPEILFTYPKNGAAIIEELQRHDLEIPFHTMIVHGETLEEDTRRIAKAAGIKIIDRFGSTETGPLSVNCPQGSWHHQFSEVVLMEFLESGHQEVGLPKQKGLLVTSFYNYAMPMVRYKNGDLIELSETPCLCGRILPKISRILGRERNMFTLSDGSRIRPDMSRDDYEPYLPARQFQVIQHSPTQIEVRYVEDGKKRPVDLKGLTQLMQRILHHDIKVTTTNVNQITRSVSGKFETWKSNIA